MIRSFWATLGTISLFLGALGIPLPLLPTVPFLLLAAFCFAKSSPRVHQWLMAHPVLGPPIHDWQRSGAIRRSAKWMATVSIATVFGLSLVLGVKLWVLGIQAVVLTAVMVFIWSRPEG